MIKGDERCGEELGVPSGRTFSGVVAVVVRTVVCGVGPPLQRGGECKGLERTF